MDIRPTPSSEVHFYKNVPFSIDYKNILLFENKGTQENYFKTLESKSFLNSSYVRSSRGTIKVNANKEELLEYNYLSFKNTLYGDKIFYAFIVGVVYSNPNTSYVTFVIDEWQTWCFDITFRDSFIERKHCKRWNSDGTPVINTQPENLEIGTQYLVKDHQQYNNNLTWVCFVSSYQVESFQAIYDVPNPLEIYYAPIYKSTSNVLNKWTLNGENMSRTNEIFTSFQNSTILSQKLVSAFMIENPPFEFSYNINGDTIQITSNDLYVYDFNVEQIYKIKTAYMHSKEVPNRTTRSFTKYGNLIDKIRRSSTDKGESKLLMYPYSFVTLLDGQGNTFDIQLEYLKDSQIRITTYTSSGNSSKLAHIVENYRHDPKDVTLGACRWELQNGIVNASTNDLTIIDNYTSAYLQGNRNQIEQGIIATQNQVALNNQMAINTRRASITAQNWIGGTETASAMAGGLGTSGGIPIVSGITQGAVSYGQLMATQELQQNNVTNTALQGNLTSERAIADAIAKYNDIQNMPDNVSLMGGNVFFTFQNQFAGYCLVYKQISDEYIKIVSDYFRKYGYAYNQIEKPNLHTRQYWDYIRTVDCNIIGKINDSSLESIKAIFNNGVTIWHTTDIGNYSLDNNEI